LPFVDCQPQFPTPVPAGSLGFHDLLGEPSLLQDSRPPPRLAPPHPARRRRVLLPCDGDHIFSGPRSRYLARSSDPPHLRVGRSAGDFSSGAPSGTRPTDHERSTPAVRSALTPLDSEVSKRCGKREPRWPIQNCQRPKGAWRGEPKSPRSTPDEQRRVNKI